MSAKHSPTPWEVFGHGRLLVIAPEAGWSVFEIEGSHPTERPTHEANAAFIVKAANNHDVLVQKLTNCVAALTFVIDGTLETDPFMAKFRATRDAAQAALDAIATP